MSQDLAKTLEKTQRNYQLDVLRLLFAICIFLYHGKMFFEKDSLFRSIADKWGWVGVHFFFMVSGLFMVNSLVKKPIPERADPGKTALQFVLNKFKGIAAPYYITFFFNLVLCILGGIEKGGDVYATVKETLIKSIPEFFVVSMAGIRPMGINTITWYISAMLLVMLPLSYLLIRKRSFFLYIFSPAAALGILSYFYGSDTPFYPHFTTGTLINGGLLRACCGLCFGGISWILAQWMKEKIKTQRQKWLLRAAELICEGIFVWVWLSQGFSSRILFPVLMLMPVILAVIFSGNSIFAALFRRPVFRFCNSLSLAIYLNHLAARRIVTDLGLFPDYTPVQKLVLMAVFTVCLCLIYYGILYLIRVIKGRVSSERCSCTK